MSTHWTPRTPDVVLGAQTIDWAGGMIDWKDPTYVAQGNAEEDELP
jgi:hypothetical protein